MIKSKKEMVLSYKITSIVCDICKREYTDDMELQEFVFIDSIGGYNSVFGDGNKIQFDICQHCLKKIIDNSK